MSASTKRIGVTLLVITGALGALTILVILFSQEIQSFLQTVIQQFGLAGLFAMTTVMDAIIQPISPDILTIGYSLSGTNTLIIGLVGGLGSCTGGLIGYGIGFLLGEKGIDKFIGKKKYRKAHGLFVQHGFWAILIGALSPVPFSAICWSAGVFKMPWKFFCISILVTRVPRFLLAGYIGSLLV